MAAKYTKTQLIIGAVALVATLVSVLSMTSLRAKLFKSQFTVVSAADMEPGGVPLGDKWLRFVHDGYPSGDGRALFWVATRKMYANEWALLSLPDGRIRCKVTGFDDMFWLPDGTAVGCLVQTARRLRVVPSVVPGSRDPDPIADLEAKCWTVDWQEGRVEKLDLATVPPDGRPQVVAFDKLLYLDHEYDTSTFQAKAEAKWAVVAPFLPAARRAATGDLVVEREGAEAQVYLVIRDSPSSRKKVCPIEMFSMVGPVCLIDVDTALVILPGGGTHPLRAYIVRLSDGRGKQVYGPSQPAYDKRLYE